MIKGRIEPIYDGNVTEVKGYKVVDQNGITQFIGSYTECYYYLFPDVDKDYSDKEAFDEAWNKKGE